MLFLKKIFRTFVFGNIFVALCAYFLSLQELYFAGKLALINPTSLFIFFSTLLIYNYRKLLFTHRELKPPFSERAQWIVNNRAVLAVITVCSVFGIFISVLSLNKQILLFLFPLFLVSVLYATPFSRKMDSLKRLRQLPFLKIFLVAGVWSAVTVLLPVIANDFKNLFSVQVIFTFCMRFIFLFAITIPFDVRDMEVDERNHIKTFPVVMGEKKAIQLSVIALTFFILMYACSGFFVSEIDNKIKFGYILSGWLSIAFVFQSLRNKREYFTSFWIEGLMLMQFVLIYIFTKIIG